MNTVRVGMKLLAEMSDDFVVEALLMLYCSSVLTQRGISVLCAAAAGYWLHQVGHRFGKRKAARLASFTCGIRRTINPRDEELLCNSCGSWLFRVRDYEFDNKIH